MDFTNRNLTDQEIDELVGLAYANVNSSAHPCDLRIADLSGALVAEARRRREAMELLVAWVDHEDVPGDKCTERCPACLLKRVNEGGKP